MRTRPITKNTCAAASPWTLGNADNTKNNDAGGATRRPKSELNQTDAVVSGEYAAKLGEQLTPYKGDTINQRTLSATPGKTYRLGLWATLGKSNDDTPSTLKVQVKSNLASLGAVSSFSQYRKTVLSETVDAESKEGGKIHYSGSFIVPLDVDPYAALWVAISQTDLASGSFAYIDNVTLVEDSAAVSDVASIAVTTQPTKTVYAIGDALDLSGMVVTATMSDGTTAELGEGEYTVSEFDSSTAGEKTITVTYAADTSLTATFKVTVKEAEPVDTVSPVISGADDVAVEFGASFDPMVGVKAVDDVDGDVTGAVKVSGDTVDTSKHGAYTLVYTVSDAAGNEASVTRVATVKEKSGETPVEPGDKDPDGDKEPGKEPGKDTDKDGDKNDQGDKKPGRSATGASVSVVAIAAIGLLATGAVSVAVRSRRDI